MQSSQEISPTGEGVRDQPSELGTDRYRDVSASRRPLPAPEPSASVTSADCGRKQKGYESDTRRAEERQLARGTLRAGGRGVVPGHRRHQAARCSPTGWTAREPTWMRFRPLIVDDEQGELHCSSSDEVDPYGVTWVLARFPAPSRRGSRRGPCSRSRPRLGPTAGAVGPRERPRCDACGLKWIADAVTVAADRVEDAGIAR